MIDMGGDRRHPMRGLAGCDERREAFGKLLRDEAGRQAPRPPALMLHQRGQERNIMADAVDDEGVERPRLRLDGAWPVAGVGDELGDHRIVMDRDFAALIDAGVVAHRHAVDASLGGRSIFHQAPGRGQETAGRVFGIDAAFDRPAVQLHVALREPELLAIGRADHFLDEIDAGDEFGHGMFDLQARVHLQEIEAAVLPRDEFDGAGRIVIDRLGERHRLLAHLLARRLVEQRRRRFLDHLLVAALDRTFALAEIDDIAVLVAEHLDFDMTRIDDELLDEDAIVAERGFRFRSRAREALGDFEAGMGDAHALAAAAGGSLDHHGIADFIGDFGGMFGRLDHAEIAGHRRDLGGVGEFLRIRSCRPSPRSPCGSGR